MGQVKRNRQRFWMCYVDGEGQPRLKHWEEEEAVKEAERLTRLTNSDVFLLEATTFCRAVEPTPPIDWRETVQ